GRAVAARARPRPARGRGAAQRPGSLRGLGGGAGRRGDADARRGGPRRG
ncbi:MAG: hypothetical protein L0027_01275, partial [Candidatus Rokubacteria bacterium]|nr:hypothetical protein [Candidatus Rokubacteria bacterium]